MVEPSEGALSISEIGCSQLVQYFQRHSGAVAVDLRLLAELLFVQEDGERLLAFKRDAHRAQCDIEKLEEAGVFTFTRQCEVTAYPTLGRKSWVAVQCTSMRSEWRISSSNSDCQHIKLWNTVQEKFPIQFANILVYFSSHPN